MSKSTTIVTSTTSLSAAADDILALQSKGRPLTKNALLNALAAHIAGPKHNWGYLTASKAPIVQRNLPAARLRDLADISAQAQAAQSAETESPAEINRAPAPALLKMNYTQGGVTRIIKLLPYDILSLYQQMLPIQTDIPGKVIRIDHLLDKYLIVTGSDPVAMQHFRHGNLVGRTKISLQTLKQDVERLLDTAVEMTWATHPQVRILNIISDALSLEAEGFAIDPIEEEMTRAVFERTISIATLAAYSQMNDDGLDLRDMLEHQGQDAIINATLDGDYTSFLHRMLGSALDEEDDEEEAEDDAPARYVVADNWSHLLEGGRETDIRWVWDREEERLVALQIWRNRSWQPASRGEFDDVTDHLANANPDALEDPVDYSAYEAKSMPGWGDPNP